MNTELRGKTVEYLVYLKETGETYLNLPNDLWETLKRLPVSPGVAPVPGEVRPVSPSMFQDRAQAPSLVPTTSPAAPGSSYPGNLSLNEKVEALKNLATQVSECARSAALFRRKKKMVFGVGDPAAEIFFVGEAPGVEEDEAGEPFMGKAGQLLTKMIEAMGLSREKVYITNVVKFRPDMPPGSFGNRKPTLEEMEVSRPFLCAQIEIIRPQVIVSLGATALEGLLKLEKSSITRMRGNWMEFAGIPLMPTFHPTYLLRNPTNEEKRKVWEDLLLVMKKVGLPISEKQQGFFLKK
jgi:uracil-DNA glycosylase